MGNIKKLPFTEIFERVQQQMRDTATGSDVEARYKAIVNDVYLRDMPSRNKNLKVTTSSTVTLNADYNTGTVAVSAGSAVVSGSGTSWSSVHTNMIMVFNDDDNIYTFAVTGASGSVGAISPTYQGSTSASGATYKLIDYDYSVGSSFVDSETTKMYYWKNNQKQYLKRYNEEDWRTKQTLTPGTPSRYRFFGEDSSYNEIFYITPPDDNGRILHIEHEKKLSPLTEYTGDCTIAKGKTAVTGASGTLFLANVDAGDYFRIDANGTKGNSKWYKVSSITSDTVVVLDSTWNETSVTTDSAFTICKVPEIPYHFHDALIWGSCMIVAVDQGDDRGVLRYTTLYLNRLGLTMRRSERKNLMKHMKPKTSLLKK